MVWSAERSGWTRSASWPKRSRSFLVDSGASERRANVTGCPVSSTREMTAEVLGSESTSLVAFPVVKAKSRVSPPLSMYTADTEGFSRSTTDSARSFVTSTSSVFSEIARPMRWSSKTGGTGSRCGRTGSPLQSDRRFVGDRGEKLQVALVVCGGRRLCARSRQRTCHAAEAARR